MCRRADASLHSARCCWMHKSHRLVDVRMQFESLPAVSSLDSFGVGTSANPKDLEGIAGLRPGHHESPLRLLQPPRLPPLGHPPPNAGRTQSSPSARWMNEKSAFHHAGHTLPLHLRGVCTWRRCPGSLDSWRVGQQTPRTGCAWAPAHLAIAYGSREIF